MFTNSIKTNGYNSVTVTRPSVARRQLETSIGAVVVIALVAVGSAFSMRANPGAANDQIAKAVTAPIVVKAAVRSVPSQRMQAIDQTRLDRRS